MKKLALGLCLLINQTSFAKDIPNVKMYIEKYASDLLKEFDRELDVAQITKVNPLESMTYARLLSLRAYKESIDHSHREGATIFSYPLYQVETFESVKDRIDKDAENIFQIRMEIKKVAEKSKLIDPPYAYPSATAKGNLFGTDFPNNVWALTFDDGPRNGKTAAIIDNLLARNIRATFFMLTADAKKFPNAAKDARDRGMDIAVHSYDHANLPKVSAAKLKYEITDAKNDLEKLLNINLKFFRLPYGAGVHNTKIRELIAENNLIHVFWNIDSLDWQDHNPESVLNRVKKLMNTTPNYSGIILFHDIHSSTLEASRLVMDFLLEKNNKLCSLNEIVDGLNGEAQTCY